MDNIPYKIYLNLGFGKEENVKDFNKLSEITWNKEPITDSDIEYLEGAAAFPVFDLLEDHLKNKATIEFQSNKWKLSDKDGDNIASGATIREMLINLIFAE